MKVLVTGATGFIGSHVVNALLEKNITVIASSTSSEKATSMPWYDEVTFVEHVIEGGDETLMEKFHQPDRVIHLAWPEVQRAKDMVHMEKYLGTQYDFLKSLLNQGAKNLTVIGSCFEYGMAGGELSEQLSTAPVTPYGLAKDTLRKWLEMTQKEQGFSFKWARLFFMHGPGQHPRSLFSQLIDALDQGEEVFNMSGGAQLRDYMRVEKVAEQIVAVALQDEVEGVINCCEGAPISVRELVEQYVRESGKSIELNLGHYPYRDFVSMAFWGDNSLIKTILKKDKAKALANIS